MLKYIKDDSTVIVMILVYIFCVCMVSLNQNKVIKDKKINIKNEEINLKFNRYLDDELIYNDDMKNEYIIKNDKVIGYNKNINVFEQNELNDQIEITDLKDLFNINMENYELEKNEDYYLYNKYINGIKTSDSIYVSFNKDKIVNIKTNKIGVFDNLVSDINKDKINEYIEKEIKNYNTSKYKIKDIMMDYKNYNYFINCIIEGENSKLISIVYHL